MLRSRAFSAAEREELWEHQKRFVNFSPAEQQRILRLYNELEQDPQGRQLRRVMKNYYDWLKTLPAYQQAQLHDLKPADRVERIRRMLAEQAKKSALPLLPRSEAKSGRLAADQNARRPSPADVEALLTWIDDYAKHHGTSFLENLPPGQREELEQQLTGETDDLRRKDLLAVIWLRWQLDNPGKVLPVTDQELRDLRAKLSPAIRGRLQGLPPAEQWRVISGMIPLFVFQQRAVRPDSTLRTASEEELARFFEKELNDQMRDRLLSLSDEEMTRELWRMYVHWKRAELTGRKPDRVRRDKPTAGATAAGKTGGENTK